MKAEAQDDPVVKVENYVEVQFISLVESWLDCGGIMH